MEIKKFLLPDAVRIDLKVTSKKQALQELAKTAQAITGASEREILDVFLHLFNGFMKGF